MYPQYPLDKAKGVTTDKFPHDTLMGIWDEFSNVVPLLPKNRYGDGSKAKTPHADFWSYGSLYRQTKANGGQVELPSRNIAETYQLRNDVSGWCVPTGREGSRLLVIDLDPKSMTDETPLDFYERVQAISPTNFVTLSPSNGLHLFYRIPDDLPLWGGSAKNLPTGVDVRCKGGQVVFIGGINHYADGSKKGVPDGHRATYSKIPYGFYDEIPEMTQALYDLVTKDRSKPTKKQEQIASKNYAKTDEGIKRLKAHFEQTVDNRNRIVLEALAVILNGWHAEKDNEDWFRLFTAAWHGCSGDTGIRDFILDHPNIYWSDGEDGRQAFIRRWASHTPEDDGYTVATLFWLARNEGWMQSTGYEISDSRMQHIDVKYISEWVNSLETIPTRMLLLSQTGSGKTYNIQNLFKRLGEPKTVIFVPTRKLATELAMTLKNEHGLPVTLYRDSDTDEIIDTEALVKAHVLVTTLQTFATKLTVDMANYGLVYVEESDQLLAQFARGGGGYNSSHVDDKQARKGFAKIREAMAKSGTVWFVDATMSKVTLTVAEQMNEGVVDVVKNNYVSDKAPVKFLADKAHAYDKVLSGLVGGRRVVVCTDTANEAKTVHDIMQKVGVLRHKKALVITRHTENRKEVRQFMENVNEQSKQYDLICYNSVMASGVSITATRPDVIVQFSSYLTPRVNLQILNRYRKQNRVYVYYGNNENLYTKTSDDVIADMESRANLESVLTNMPIANRLPDARLRALVAAISTADEGMQRRTPKDFYKGLLEADGRIVEYEDETSVYGKLESAIDAIKEIRKAQKETIANTWHEVPPIDEHRQAEPDYTVLQVLQGEAHAMIERALRGHIPENVPPREIYDIVTDFVRYGFILTAFIKQDLALKRSEFYLADNGRSLMNLANNVTLIRLMRHVAIMFNHSDEVLAPDDLRTRSRQFMEALTLAKDSYDNVITRGRQKFHVIYGKNETVEARALAFTKILLAKVGLKVRSKKIRIEGEKRPHYYIANISAARKFLEWRNADDTDFEANIRFDDSPIITAVDNRKEAYDLYKGMSEDKQEQIFALMNEFNDFNVAVDVIKKGGIKW